MNGFLAKRYPIEQSNPVTLAASLTSNENIINLSIGDPDFITHKLIIGNAFNDAEKGHTKYTKPSGDPELKEEIQKFYKEEYQINIDQPEIMVTVGACHAMYLSLKACIDEGDEVIVPEPYFTPYKDQIEHVKGVMVPLKTKEGDGFNLNIEDLKALINPKTKAVIINSPNNPTGACYDKSTLEQLAQLAIDNNFIIISDEVYEPYIFEGDFTSILSISGMKERSILIGSFSKAYAMTGWRVGYAVAPDFVIDCMIEINESICFTAPSISQRAAIYAFKNRKIIQPSIIKEFRERIIYAYNRINLIKGMRCLKPKGSIYLFVNIEGTGMGSNEFCKLLLEKAKVVVLPGNVFGENGEGFVRIACIVDINKLREALDRIEQLFN